MAIGRTEFEFSVSGADETAAAHRDVAAAERAQAKAADEAARAAARLDEGLVRERLALQDAEQAIVKKIRAEQAAKKELDGLLNPTRELTKETSALGKAGSLASAGLTMLRKAAEIIPGVELGTIIAGAAAGLYGLYQLFKDTTTQTGMMTDAMTAYGQEVAKVATESAKKFDELRVSQARAGLAMVGGALGVRGEQLPFDQAMGAQKLQGEIEAARETQRKSLEGVAELERRRAALDIDKARAGTLLPTDPLAIDLRRRQIEINEQRRGFRAAYDAAAAELRSLSAPYESTGRSGGRGGRGGRAVDTSLGATVGRIAAEQSPRRAMESGALAGIGGMAGESYDASAEAARARAQESADFQIAQDQRNAMMIAHMQGVQAEAANTANAMDMLAGSFDGAFARMVSSATDAGGMLMQALSVITGAVGSMMTNLIISGSAGSKGVAKAAGNALAGISAQAFGYGVLLEGLAAASALVPILGFSAPSLAAAGAVMFGVGAALGVTARALGADKLGAGGRSSAGASAGGRGGGSSAAVGTGSGGGRGEAPVYVSVQIGEEPVAAIMRRSNERESRRGGMNGHFAMGAA
jgi:hypothetical protein